MTAKPILFSGPMVHTLLDGRKTQTRRIVKPQPHHGPVGQMVNLGGADWAMDDGDLSGQWRCPYGVPGDLLWVRESGELVRDAYDHDPATGQDLWRDVGWVHSADGTIAEKAHPFQIAPLADWIGDCARLVRPSIHMPRWASRLTLRITDVRIERLLECSDDDARAEGLQWVTPGMYSVGGGLPIIGSDPRQVYFELWDHINGAGSAAANPWVWVVSFDVLRLNVDQLGVHDPEGHGTEGTPASHEFRDSPSSSTPTHQEGEL